MNKLIGEIIAKFTIVLFIIVTMLFSSVRPIITWAVETTQTESQYINFDIKWENNDSDEISMNNGVATASFDLQFDTIKTFKDFRIEVEQADLVRVGFNNSGEYFGGASGKTQIQYLKDIPGGTKLTGNISFSFDRASDYSKYSRDIVIKLIGTYELDGEQVDVTITKNLKANITSTPITKSHNAKMQFKANSPSVYASVNTPELYKVANITETYEIYIEASNSEHTKLEFSLYRKGTNNDKVYYPTNVTFSDNKIYTSEQSRVFNFYKVENEDGAISYIAEKGEEHDEYASDNIFELGKTFFLTVYYEIDDAQQEGSTTMTSNVKLTSDGYTITTDAEGTTNTKTKIARK
ncbi:MAG: hypothetical protein IJX34_01445 [Clostridia bacterium]|nr:hypothetical protein [Clostridia bacterium]